MPPPHLPDFPDELSHSLHQIVSPVFDVDALACHAEVLALAVQLDLEPARPLLQACYAPSPRGGKPWDPVVLLRCLLVMVHLRETSINHWVPKLRSSAVFRAACGLNLTGPTPGVGTFYDFLHRLHDGPRRLIPGLAAPERHSLIERRRVSAPVPASTKPKKGDDRKGGESLTAKIVKDLDAKVDQRRPAELLYRLSDLLLLVAVQPSAERGLLGDTRALITHGDGSSLTTGADRQGHKSCEHGRFERCDCAKTWTDPDARWGYVASVDKYFFGHHFYEISVSSEGRDLPIALRLDPGNSSDFAQSLWTMDALRKQWTERGLNWKIGAFVADAARVRVTAQASPDDFLA